MTRRKQRLRSVKVLDFNLILSGLTKSNFFVNFFFKGSRRSADEEEEEVEVEAVEDLREVAEENLDQNKPSWIQNIPNSKINKVIKTVKDEFIYLVILSSHLLIVMFHDYNFKETYVLNIRNKNTLHI